MQQSRILLTTPTYPPFNSGLGNAVQQQATALINEGYSVTVATGGQERAQRYDAVSGALVEQFVVQGADSWISPIRGDVNGYGRFLIDSDFDILLINAWQTWSTDLCFRNLEKIQGRKFLYSHCLSTNVFFRDQPIRSSLRYLLWRPYWWKLPARMAKLDGLVFLSDSGSDSRFDDLRLANRLGLPCHTVPNALSPAAMTILGQPDAGRRTRGQLIAIGSYDWLKGHDFVLNAYARSSAKNKIPLKIFGQKFSPFTAKLRLQAARLGIEDRYISFQEGVSGAELLSECSQSIALLSGSHTECQPLVLLDSMAAGTPFIARSTGCVSSLAGGVGVKTEVSAAQMIDRMVTDDAKWESLSRAGKEQVARNNHPVTVGQKLAAILAGAH